MMRMQLEAEFAAEYFVTEKTRRARFFDGFFKALVDIPDFAVNVVVAHGNTHGVSGNRHALDHAMRVVTHDVAIFKRARLAFVGIAHQILRARKLPRHEAPLEPGRKPRTTTSTQRRLFKLRDDRLGRDFFAEYLLQRLIAAARLIILDAPIGAVDVLHDQGIGAVNAFRERRCRETDHFSSSSSLSILSFDMAHNICLLLRMNTGASPHAPMHSPSFRVKRPSGVVSPKPTPSFFFK